MRPKIVDIKHRTGDLKIDLVIEKNNKEVNLTNNDNATGMLFMYKIESKEAASVKAKTI